MKDAGKLGSRAGLHRVVDSSAIGAGKSNRAAEIYGAVQRRRTETVDAPASADAVQQAAAVGVRDGGGELPHGERIQQSFGRHDVGDVRAHVGGAAKEASDNIGAEAYALGTHVAFRGPPSLSTAAHEAAHVIQQRGGVQLEGGVGEVGDRYEQQADEVADRVVKGESAEDLLDATPSGKTGGEPAVQRLPNAEMNERRPSLIARRRRFSRRRPLHLTSTTTPRSRRGFARVFQHKAPAPRETRADLVRELIEKQTLGEEIGKIFEMVGKLGGGGIPELGGRGDMPDGLGGFGIDRPGGALGGGHDLGLEDGLPGGGRGGADFSGLGTLGDAFLNPKGSPAVPGGVGDPRLGRALEGNDLDHLQNLQSLGMDGSEGWDPTDTVRAGADALPSTDNAWRDAVNRAVFCVTQGVDAAPDDQKIADRIADDADADAQRASEYLKTQSGETSSSAGRAIRGAFRSLVAAIKALIKLIFGNEGDGGDADGGDAGGGDTGGGDAGGSDTGGGDTGGGDAGGDSRDNGTGSDNGGDDADLDEGTDSTPNPDGGIPPATAAAVQRVLHEWATFRSSFMDPGIEGNSARAQKAKADDAAKLVGSNSLGPLIIPNEGAEGGGPSAPKAGPDTLIDPTRELGQVVGGTKPGDSSNGGGGDGGNPEANTDD